MWLRGLRVAWQARDHCFLLAESDAFLMPFRRMHASDPQLFLWDQAAFDDENLFDVAN
jgi:hypothetical protein